MPERTTGSAGEIRLAVCFAVDDALCALDSEPLQEVVRVGRITPVHHAPEHVLGVTNLRGRIVTVIDMRLRLGLDRVEHTPETRVLIVSCGGEPVGLLVEREAGALEYDAGGILPPPRNVEGRFGAMLKGVFTSNGRLVALLDDAEVTAARVQTAAP